MHYGALPGSSTEADIRAVIGDDARAKFMKPGDTRKFSLEMALTERESSRTP
jgi:hypothetical protein